MIHYINVLKKKGYNMFDRKSNHTKYDRNKFRERHVIEYISLFYPELKKKLKDCEVLDIGCGSGVLALSLAPYVKSVNGIDVDLNSIKKARKTAKKKKIKNVFFIRQSAFELSKNKKYDIILLSDVLEHVKEQKRLLEKSLDVLKIDGVLYINTPNKWFPMEAHEHLLFLSYLPRKLADRYYKAIRKRNCPIYYLLSYSELVRLLNSLQINYTFKPFRHPTRPLYKLGKPFINISPFFWHFSNAFQVIVNKQNR